MQFETLSIPVMGMELYFVKLTRRSKQIFIKKIRYLDENIEQANL